jgi:hypothetical protein
MIWVFHRYGKYLSCEVRTSFENEGFEILIAKDGETNCEWYPDQEQIERRWDTLTEELRKEGWGELYEGPD